MVILFPYMEIYFPVLVYYNDNDKLNFLYYVVMNYYLNFNKTITHKYISGICARRNNVLTPNKWEK